MFLLRFTDSGYECTDQLDHFIFDSGDSHELLFNYVSKDIDVVPFNIIDNYVSKIIDDRTLDILSLPDSFRVDIDKIRTLFGNIHPYFYYDFFTIVSFAIESSFRMLMNKHSHILTSQRSDQVRSWLYVRFSTLLQPFFKGQTLKKTCEQIIDQYYIDRNGKILFSSEPIDFNSFYNEQLQLRVDARRMLSHILDISENNRFNELTTQERVWTYGMLYRQGSAILPHFNRQLARPTRILSFDPVSNNHVDIDVDADLFINGHANDSDWKKLFATAKKASKFASFESYEINSLRDLITLEIMHMIETEVPIRPCENCKRYFIVTNRNQKYCDRPFQDGKTCSQIGASQKFKDTHTNEAYSLHKSAYNTMALRVKRGTLDSNEFDVWKKEARSKRDQVISGSMSASDFKEWLDFEKNKLKKKK